MIRFAPLFVLVVVTTLLAGYGRHPWSWVAGPVAALAVWSFDRKAHEPGTAAPARALREPAPVD